jgi:hypothetical protein
MQLQHKIIITLLPLGQFNCAPPLTKPISTVKQHMQEVIIPASNVLFAAAGETPKNDAEWGKVKSSALALVDSGKWLFAYPLTIDSQPWLQATQNLVDAAQTTVKAATVKDADTVAVAGNILYQACESCHAVYLNKLVKIE